MNLAELRLNLATARAEQRTAKDALDTAKIVATLDVTGRSDDERKKAAAQVLLGNTAYTNALAHYRSIEANIDTLEAQIANEEDTIRLRELEARERLAEALLGRRVDNVSADRVARLHVRPIRVLNEEDEPPF